jgi:hypothetical protein
MKAQARMQTEVPKKSSFFARLLALQSHLLILSCLQPPLLKQAHLDKK